MTAVIGHWEKNEREIFIFRLTIIYYLIFNFSHSHEKIIPGIRELAWHMETSVFLGDAWHS